jgi:hypothetical protein
MGIEPVIPNVVAFQGDDMFGWNINLTGNDLLTGEKVLLPCWCGIARMDGVETRSVTSARPC